MTPKAKLYTNLVAIAVLGVVMVTWVVTQIAGTGLWGGPYRVVADLAGSGGVFTNQEVTYRGVLVGKVGTLSLNDDGVDIELVIDGAWRDRIPSDLVLNVRSKSAVGEQFVNLTPLSEGGPTLADGDRIARERTELPVDFQELLASLDAVLADVPPEEAEELVRTLAGGVGGKGREIATILNSLGRLADAFATAAPEQERLLRSATTAGAEFLRTKDSFAEAIRAADEVFAGIGDEPEELKAFIRENDALARAGSDLLARRGRELRGGIRALADLTEFQLDERDAVLQALTYQPQFFKAIEEASILWRSPDGRTFYRIRGGLVLDNVRSSWPCKYRHPPRHERHYFVRGERTVRKAGECLPPTTTAARAALLEAAREWVEEASARHPNVLP